MTDTGVLEDAVASFSRMSPDQIAETMRRRKIAGRPGTTGSCPLAKLMQNGYGGRFIVGPKFVARQCGKRLEKIPTPKNLTQFLRAFDLSRYPDLIAPPPRVLGVKQSRNKTGKTKKRGKVVNRPAKLVGRW